MATGDWFPGRNTYIRSSSNVVYFVLVLIRVPLRIPIRGSRPVGHLRFLADTTNRRKNAMATSLERSNSTHPSKLRTLAALFAVGAVSALIQTSSASVAGADQGSATTTAPLPQVYATRIVDTPDIPTVVAEQQTKTVPGPTKPGKAKPSEVVVSILPASAPPTTAATTSKAKRAKKNTPSTAAPAAPAAAVDSGESNVATTTEQKTRRVKQKSTDATTPPADTVVAKSDSGNSALDSAFAALRKCESGDNYKINTGNGYYGAYQFSAQTWRSLGYSGLPSDASPETQDEAARRLQAKAGWGQWPACSRKLGLR
jgi:Transglycosylase-like domain